MGQGTYRPSQIGDVVGKNLLEGLTLLIGRAEIAKYCRCSQDTVTRWIKKQAFPAGPLPNGWLAVSVFAIDRWLEARGKAYRENMERLRKERQSATQTEV